MTLGIETIDYISEILKLGHVTINFDLINDSAISVTVW